MMLFFLSDPKREASDRENDRAVRFPLKPEPTALGFRFVKNNRSLRLPFRSEARGFGSVENEKKKDCRTNAEALARNDE